MKQVIIFPRGQLTKADRETIRRAGAVAVEADDPKQVVTAIPSVAAVSGDDLLLSALHALAAAGSWNGSVEFVKDLNRRAQKAPK